MPDAGPRNIIAVASGKGGVGKSTVAMNLAIALRERGLRVGLLDADIYGPSQQRMLGVAESVTPENLQDKYIRPIEARGILAMSMGFLATERTPMAWRGPMASGALVQMLEQTLWGDLDVLLVDMPPGTGDIQLTLAQRAALAGAIIVTTPQDIALIDAQKGVEMFNKVNVPVLGVVENMSIHVCSACGHQEAVFGTGGGDSLAADYGVDVIARLPLSLAIREQADSGAAMVDTAPESTEAAAFLAAADALLAKLQSGDERAAPTITMSED